MGARLRLASALLLATAFVPQCGASSTFPVDFEFETDNGVALAGAFDATLGLAGITYTGLIPAHAGLDVKDSRVTIMAQSYVTGWVDDVLVRNEYGQQRRVVEEFDFTGHIDIDAQDDAMVHFLRAETGKPLELQFNSTDSARLTTNRELAAYAFFPEAESGRRLYPALDAGQLQPPIDDLEPSGDATVMVYQASLVFDDGNGRRAIYTGPNEAVGVDQPRARMTRDERTYAVIEARQPSFLLSNAKDGWLLHAQMITGALAGDASFVGVQGFSGSPEPPTLDSSLIQVSGFLDVEATYQDASQTWRVTGEATHFGVDGTTIHGQRGPSMAASIAISGGIVATALWLARRFIVQGFAAIVGYNTSDPLRNETRVRMLVLIAQEPGVGVGSLIKALGVRRASVLFHAGVLASAGYITVTKQGAHWRFVADKSLPALLETKAPKEPVAVLACLQHPIRRTIAGLLVTRQAALPAVEIEQALRGLGHVVSRQVLQYHLPVLVSAGVLKAAQRNRTLEYSAVEMPSASHIAQTTATIPMGRAPSRRSVRIKTMPAVLEALVQHGIRLPVRQRDGIQSDESIPMEAVK